MTPAARLGWLVGRWRVSRAIRHAGGARARFRGEAVWAAEGAGLLCVEAGTLEQARVAFPARRETRWRATRAGVAVTLADGRPFVVVSGTRARHDCAPDVYLVDHDFGASGFWSERWRVTGPRKDWRAITRYVRL